MFKKRNNEDVEDLFKNYKKQADGWEKNQYAQQRKYIVGMVILLCFSLTANLGQGLALASLIPLKEKEPYLIRVDSSTGIAETLSKNDLQNAKWSESEQTALDKYFLSKYVINRESYNYAIIDSVYNETSLMSTPAVGTQYQQQITRNNPNSPINKYGKNTLVQIQIRSISFPESDGEQVAYVRFIRTAVGQDKNVFGKPEHLLATINYTYSNEELNNEIRAVNPLGFVVTGYQTTQGVY